MVGCYFTGGCRHTNLLDGSSQLASDPCTRSWAAPLKGGSEKTASARAVGSEGRQCDPDRKITFTQPKSSSVTVHAALLSFFSLPDNQAWCFEASINPLFMTLPIFLEKCSVLVLCMPIWFLFEYLFQKTHPYCSTVQPIAMKRKIIKSLRKNVSFWVLYLDQTWIWKASLDHPKNIFSQYQSRLLEF